MLLQPTMKKEIITIAGKPGSGKSTTAKILGETLGFDRYSAGSFLRDLAKERGISIEEASQLAKEDPFLDKQLDGATAEIGRTRDRIIVDGRVAFHFIPESFKVYLDLDLRTAAERIFKEQTTERHESGETADSVEAMHSSIANRFTIEQSRYRSLYGIDPNDLAQFDLVVDTANHTPPQVAAEIAEAYKNWLVA